MVPHSVVWKLVVTTTASAVVDHFFVEPYIRPQLQKIKPPFGFSSSEEESRDETPAAEPENEGDPILRKAQELGFG